MVRGIMGNDEGLPGSPERVDQPCSRVVDGLGRKTDGEKPHGGFGFGIDQSRVVD